MPGLHIHAVALAELPPTRPSCREGRDTPGPHHIGHRGLFFEPCRATCPPLTLSSSPSFPSAAFYGFIERKGDFSFPRLLHSIAPICPSRPSVPCFFGVLWLWAPRDALQGEAGVGRRSGSQASACSGGNVPLQINQFSPPEMLMGEKQLKQPVFY